MLLCLDFENAVDYVRWKFMFKVSKTFGFNENYVDG